MAILNCPGCDRGGLRVPDGRRGKVTCPTCGAEWFYPETIELSEVEFRCSASGARFVVVLARRSPLHQFVIHSIKNAAPRASGPASADDKGLQVNQLSVPAANTSALLPHRATGWLACIQNFKDHYASTQRSTVARHAAPAQSVTTYDAKEYNWSSFFCPYCNATGFVKCTGRHLACDGGVQIRNGSRFHQCFCGNAGVISGMIESYEGKRSTLDNADAANTAAEGGGAEKESSGGAALPETGSASSKQISRKT